MTGGDDPASELLTFVQSVYGGCAGWIEVTYFVHGKTRSSHIPIDLFLPSADAILELSDKGYDVYLGCATLVEKPEKGRGKAGPRFDVPGAWLDLDLAVEGHHKRTADGLRRFSSEDEVRAVLEKADLPEPSVLIHSGGGLYAWWLYPEPISLQDDPLDRSSGLALVTALNEHVSRVAAEHGVSVDRLGDPARVLRPPGTLNWKRGAINPPAVRLISLREDARILPDELAARLEDVNLGRRFSAGTKEKRSTGRGEGGNDLPDAAKAASWEEILFPVGWSYGAPVSGATSFLRPDHANVSGPKPGDGYVSYSGVDDGAKSAGVYDDGPEVLVVWSDACGLPFGSGQKLTKFRVMAHLWFGGNLAACARDLGNAALARAAGACSGSEEDVAGLVRSVWPAAVLERALESLGGGWKVATGASWTVRIREGAVHVRKQKFQ